MPVPSVSVCCFVFPQSLTKGGLSVWHIFKKCSKSTFLFLNSGVFLHYAEMTCFFPRSFNCCYFRFHLCFPALCCTLLYVSQPLRIQRVLQHLATGALKEWGSIVVCEELVDSQKPFILGSSGTSTIFISTS